MHVEMFPSIKQLSPTLFFMTRFLG